MRPCPLLLLAAVLTVACKPHHPGNTPPLRSPRDSSRVMRQPVVVRDTALEQRAARLELKALEQEAQVDELQSRLEYSQGSRLLQLATAEFDQQNYAGALYLATEAKNAAAAGQGRVGGDDRQITRKGEVPFALPLRLQTTGRANVRDGPGSGFKVLFTLETGVAIVAYSYVDQWVRIKDDSDRPGWIHQTLIDRRQ